MQSLEFLALIITTITFYFGPGIHKLTTAIGLKTLAVKN